jgi:hypothetical protein
MPAALSPPIRPAAPPDPPTLLVVARAAHLSGHRDLSRAACLLLRTCWGVRVSFVRADEEEVRRAS